MQEELFYIKNIYLQRTFSSHTARRLGRLFGLSEQEMPLCAVWVHPVLRCGFMMSDSALYWRLCPIGGGLRVGVLCKTAVSHADFVSFEMVESVNGRYHSRLTMNAGDRHDSFSIVGLPEEKCRTLCDILRYGLTRGIFPQDDCGGLVDEAPFRAVYAAFDGTICGIGDWWAEFKAFAGLSKRRQAESSFAADDNADETASFSSAGTEASTECKKHPRSTGSMRMVSLILVDLAASLAFMAAVVIAVKPELLVKDPHHFPRSLEAVEKVGRHFLQFNIIETAHPKLVYGRNVCVALFLLCYALGKCIVLALSKNGARKIISMLLLAMMLLSCTLVMDKFLLFTLYAILIFVCFQYSLGLHSRAVICKCIALVLLGLTAYVAAHILTQPTISVNIAMVFRALKRLAVDFAFPVRRWL